MNTLRRPYPLLLRLAFVAGLLLALLPTLGRLHRALDPDPQAPGWVALCTAQGLVIRPLDPAAGSDSGDIAGGQGQGSGHAGDECAYCPLLAATCLPQAPTLVWLSPVPPRTDVPALPAPLRADLYVSGWSPRGPPSLLV